MASFLPNTDPALLAWSLNFSTLITATPTAYNLTATLATAYAAVHTAFATALAACDPGQRSKTLVSAKNSARATLKAQARLLASTVQGGASVTPAQKIELGLTVRSAPSPIPAPVTAPVLSVSLVNQNIVTVKLRGTDLNKRGKPAGVDGATIFSYVGLTPPANINDWKFEGSTSKTTASIAFPLSAEPFSKVFLTAFWFNPAKKTGPACAPVATNLGTWLVQTQAGEQQTTLRAAA